MTRLHDLSALLDGRDEVADKLQAILRAAVDITVADMGDIQRFSDDGVLTIAAHEGLPAAFLKHFARVDVDSHTTCGAALASRSRVIVEDIGASPLFNDAASAPVMAAAGARAVQTTPLFGRDGALLGMFSSHYCAPHVFSPDELRWIDLLARHASDVLERERIDLRLARAREEMEQRVAERTRWLSLVHSVSRAIAEAPGWNEALRRVLRQLCEAEGWQVGIVYLPGPEQPAVLAPAVGCFAGERFRAFYDLSFRQRFRPGEYLPGLVYRDAAPVWVNDAGELAARMPLRAAAVREAGFRSAVVLPIAAGDGILAVLELLSDEPHPRNEELVVLMRDVGDQIGRTLERERLTASMGDLVWREQQALLHTLHDAVGQTLTGLGMLATGLRDRLADSEAGTAGTAAEIARQAQLALDQVRGLTRSLFPLQVTSGSLVLALRDLAAATEALHKIPTRVEGDLPEQLHDGKAATELYRIAQEAVTNAIRHARAQAITISLDGGEPGTIRLSVADDGVGIPPGEAPDGMGIRIMQYRATSLGASLSIGRAKKTGGTIVSCVLQVPPDRRAAGA
jgi:signal transduction histidine kinase